MFSFPNKKRKLDWINELVKSDSSSLNNDGLKITSQAPSQSSNTVTSDFNDGLSEMSGVGTSRSRLPRASVSSGISLLVLSDIPDTSSSGNSAFFDRASSHETRMTDSSEDEHEDDHYDMSHSGGKIAVQNERTVDDRDQSTTGSGENGQLTVSYTPLDQAITTESTRDDTVVHLDATHIDDNRELAVTTHYLQVYYDMMYYFGVSAYDDPMENSNDAAWSRWIPKVFQKVAFLYVGTMSGFQSLCHVKYSFLTIMSNDGGKRYNSFVDFSYNSASLLIKISSAYILSFTNEKTSRMFRLMRAYEKAYCPTKDKPQWWGKKLVVLLGVATFIFAGARTLFATGRYTVVEVIRLTSSEFSEDLFIWESKNMSEVSFELEDKYGSNVTATTLIFSSAVLQRNMASYLQIGMVYDLIILLGVVLYNFVIKFMKDVKEVTPRDEFEDVKANDLQLKREIAWKKFRALKQVVDSVNDVFDPLLKLLHVGNLLMYAFFMVLIVFDGAAPLTLVLYTINLAKAELGYFIAGKIAEQNNGIRAWIRNWALYSGKIRMGSNDMDVTVVLDELDKEPIGLGVGNFLIHQTFHYKLLGLVLSIFFSMADEEQNVFHFTLGQFSSSLHILQLLTLTSERAQVLDNPENITSMKLSLGLCLIKTAVILTLVLMVSAIPARTTKRITSRQMQGNG